MTGSDQVYKKIAPVLCNIQEYTAPAANIVLVLCVCVLNRALATGAGDTAGSAAGLRLVHRNRNTPPHPNNECHNAAYKQRLRGLGANTLRRESHRPASCQERGRCGDVKMSSRHVFALGRALSLTNLQPGSAALVAAGRGGPWEQHCSSQFRALSSSSGASQASAQTAISNAATATAASAFSRPFMFDVPSPRIRALLVRPSRMLWAMHSVRPPAPPPFPVRAPALACSLTVQPLVATTHNHHAVPPLLTACRPQVDAAGTLLIPSEPVTEVYLRAAAKHGVKIQLSEREVLDNFRRWASDSGARGRAHAHAHCSHARPSRSRWAPFGANACSRRPLHARAPPRSANIHAPALGAATGSCQTRTGLFPASPAL
jgi:hypothetical protein